MTGLEIIPVPAGTVITSNDGRSTLTVKPVEVVAKGHKLFVVKEDFDRIRDQIDRMHQWEKEPAR